MRGENPWEYGLTEGNRPLDVQQHAADHGLVDNPYPLEDLFVKSTL